MIDRLYIDMDGVMVNFDGRVDGLGCRLAPGKHPSYVDWNRVKEIGPDFWATMSWLPEGKAFFEECQQVCRDNGIEMGILTAISIPAGVKGKTLWVHWNTDIDNEHLIIVPHGYDKCRFAAPERVLVDDDPRNISDWNNAGGTGILYTDAAGAFREILGLI